MPNNYETFPARYHLRRTIRDSADLPAQPDPQSVAIALEIVSRATRDYASPPKEAVRQHLDEEMRLCALGLSADKLAAIAELESDTGLAFVPKERR